MTTISAKTILRSRHAAKPDKVVSTLLLRYPRWIHAEGRTHRQLRIGEDDAAGIVFESDWEPRTPSLMEDPMLSRNAASSRAIPVAKMIDDILADPAVPLFWGANQRGMQAPEECTAMIHMGDATFDREGAWLWHMNEAIRIARAYAEAGYAKQIVNRLLEPFSHITVVVSATEWDNFLELRDHADAEPHIAMLAREIRKCLEDESTIRWLEPGDWHLPFVDKTDWLALSKLDSVPAGRLSSAKKLSFARCASTSYKTVDGFDMSFERAEALHDRLMAARPVHASPAEHVCQADDWLRGGGWLRREQHGNFVGFRQYRHTLEMAA